MRNTTICLSPTFKLGSYRDQAFLIHECTHAHLDIQNSGYHMRWDNEATGYIAEAVFLEALKKPPLGRQKIRSLAHQIAKHILGGTYLVPEGDAIELTREIWKHPEYHKNVLIESDGVWTMKSWFNPSK